jgi:hypothetical protein
MAEMYDSPAVMDLWHPWRETLRMRETAVDGIWNPPSAQDHHTREKFHGQAGAVQGCVLETARSEQARLQQSNRMLDSTDVAVQSMEAEYLLS